MPIGSLPEPMGNAVVYGETTEFGGRVPVCGMAGDQQAALYGQGCHSPGLGKNTYGTGNFLLQHAGAGSPLLEQGLITTIAWGIGDRVDYALESSMFVTGAAVQWLRDGLGIIERADETEALAASLDGNDGVYFVPALTGLGSPHWDPYARGTIVGLTRGAGRAHLARATLEAIAYQTADAVRAQNTALGVSLEELRADGGATANGWLMQFQADVLGVPVVVPEVSETTVLGAAYLAGHHRRLLDRGGHARDVARGAPLRAAHGRGRARGAAGAMAAARSGARAAGRRPTAKMQVLTTEANK